jgi:RimJ/RimL family protein N-acetyltransferase
MNIIINKKKYNYKLFDTNELIELIRHDKKFIEALENTIKIYRKNENFKIFDLIREYIHSKLDDITNYFIIYKKDIIISTLRFYYNLKKKSGYFNLVYTNPDYRGQQICQNSIKYLIELNEKICNKFELEVDIDNASAIKCYENIGFKKIKETNYDGKIICLMRLKIR